jgi:hypothetical protein
MSFFAVLPKIPTMKVLFIKEKEEEEEETVELVRR